MARKRRSQAKKPRPLQPEDVLSGRIEIRVEALFDLIHLVNPTHRDLAKLEKARRYEQKGRLQSLLIRRFGDEHVMVESAEQDGVVSLVHRSGAKDACHAVVSELEPDARSWVQRQLDLAASPALDFVDQNSVDRNPVDRNFQTGRRNGLTAEEDDLSTVSVDDLLVLARQALEDYDYETAETRLRVAYDRRQDRADVAQALLDLVVGVLGMDQQAPEIEAKLPPRARADPEVQTVLALAAARLGDVQRALELVKGTDLTRAAEVYAVLAAQAIHERDRQAAGRYLERVSSHQPTHPEIPRLGEEIAKLRAEDLRGPEAELERRYQSLGGFAVEDEARALAGRWPECELARGILREVAAQRRESEIAEHLAVAENAMAREKFDDAARHFQAAVDAGCDRADLPALIEEARDQQRQGQEQARVGAVVHHFTAATGGLRSALLGYLALPEVLRVQVREHVGEPSLTWLDQIETPRSVARGQTVVIAVLALGEATEMLARGDAQAAFDLIKPHMDVLAEVEEGRGCFQAAGSQLTAERRERGVRALDDAWETWRGGQIQPAKELLETIDPETLGADDQSRMDELRGSIQHAETVEQLAQAYERHLASKDYLGALDRAGELVDKAPEPGPWIDRVEQIHRRLRTAWRVEVSNDPVPLEEIREFWCSTNMEQPPIWLDDEGRKLILANVWGDWLFLRFVDVESQTVHGCLSLRTPEPLKEPSICWEGDRVRVAGAQGAVLELGLKDWRILGWKTVQGLLPRGKVPQVAELLPGSDYLWLDVGTVREGNKQWMAGDETTYVVDLSVGRVSRHLPLSWCGFMIVVGSGEPCVATSSSEAQFRFNKSEGTVRIYNARGTEAAEFRLAGSLNGVAVGPAGKGLLLLLTLRNLADDQPPMADEDDLHDEDDLQDEDDLYDEDDGDLFLVHIEEPFPAVISAIGNKFEIPHACSISVHTVATSLGQGLVFVLVTSPERKRSLMAMNPSLGTFELLYRVAMPFASLLVRDRHARHVVAVLMDGLSPRIFAPRADEPEAMASVSSSESEGIDVLTEFNYSHCHSVVGKANARVQALVARLMEMSPVARRRFSRNFEADFRDDADARSELCLALRRSGGEEEELRQFTQLLVEDHPLHEGAALLMADLEAEASRWDDVLQRLRDVSPMILDDCRACHYYHLLGLARFHTGQPGEALKAFRLGWDYELGRCSLNSLIVLAQALVDPLDTDDWGLNQPVIRQLVGSIRLADRAFAISDMEAVREALEKPALWRGEEPQSAARLATVYLEREPTTAHERFVKRHALAFYRHVMRPEESRLMKLILPGLAWDKARLAELEKRAGAWLEEDRE